MPAPFKDPPADYFQNQLFPSNVFDLLPDDHDCFVYRDLFEQLDTSEVDAQYSRRGQHAYAPRQVVSILIYAYSHGVFSSRQIEKRCNEDLGFMHIAGKRCPNFRVLSDFRKDQGDFFRSCFKQTVQMALELDMVSLGHVSLDGSKFKANSSKHKAMSYGRMKERERRLCAEIEVLVERARRCDEEDRAYRERTGYELRDDLRDKQQRLERIRQAKRALEAREAELRPGQVIEDNKQISFADKDARIMGKKGAFDYAYNALVGVDGDAQIIVGQHVSQAANDQQEVDRALDELEASSGRLPDKMSLDNGYYSGDNLQAMSDRGVAAYIATDRGREGGLSLRRGAGRFSLPWRSVPGVAARGCRGPARVSGRDRGLRNLCLPCPLLPVEVRSGAHGDERRPGAAAPSHERADVATGEPGDLPPSQGDCGTRVRADQEHGFPGFRRAGAVEGGRGVLAGMRGAQRQENGPCGDSGSGASGVRTKGGAGVELGRRGLWT